MKSDVIQQVKKVKEWHLYAARKGPYYIYPLEVLKRGLCEGFKGRLGDFYFGTKREESKSSLLLSRASEKTHTQSGFYISVQPDVFYGDGWAEIRYSKDEMARFGKLVLQKILKEPDFAKQALQYSKKQARGLWRAGEELLKVDIADNKDAFKRLASFHQTYINSTFYGQVTWFGGRRALSDYLKQYLEKKVEKGLVGGYLAVLASPAKPSFVFREKQDLIKIAQKKAKRIDITKDIKRHTKDFEWLVFDYNGPKIYNEKYFLSRVNDLLKGALEKEAEKANHYFTDLKEKQEGLFEKLKIDGHYRRLFRDIQTMVLQQDFKKEATTKAHLSVCRFLKKLAKKRGIEPKTFFYLTSREIENFVLSNKLNQEDINQRKQFCLVVTMLQGTEVFTGRQARELAEFIRSRDDTAAALKQKGPSSIKGEIASKGKVRGAVKVITDPKDISQMPKGAVLAARMTTLALMPAVKKASAIITDEGGITCHAAIVSRELGIPCIIGTKVATKVLKDGDLVEVDADKGLVKIIKKPAQNR